MLNFKQPTWAHAELFGHSSYFCRAQEVSFCGSHGLAIEPVTVDGILPAFFAAGAAIFRLTPMSEDDVRHAVLPRAFRACEAFQPAPVLPTSCRVCGRNEPEHEEERQRKALPPSPRAESPIPDASFEEGEDDDIPFESRLERRFVDLHPEDYNILAAVRDFLRDEPRHPDAAYARTLVSGHDTIEIIRAPLASSVDVDKSLDERVRAALDGTPIANVDLLAATVRADVSCVARILAMLGWTLDAHGLWNRSPENCPRCGLVLDAAGWCSGRKDGCQGCRAEIQH